MAWIIYELDFSDRHCWEMADGNYRLAKGSTFETRICHKVKDHPKKAGNSEYIRWIRNFGILAPGIVTGFGEGWLKLGNQDGIGYCENYGDKVKAYLNHPTQGVASVWILDKNLVDASQKAFNQTLDEYEAMVK